MVTEPVSIGVYNIHQVAAVCECSVSSIERADKAGRMPARLAAFPGRRLWSKVVIDRWLASHSAPRSL